MRNIKLTIAYDGTDFRGWQAQPAQSTIQGALVGVIQRITQDSPTLNGAGRTDAGVHAWGQVASFATEARLTSGEFLRAMNALLPPTIRVREAVEVPDEFHARWHALAKTYRYRIYRGAVVPPTHWRYVLHDPGPLDFAAMSEAARLFEGEHDFSTFAASTGSEEEDEARVTVRAIYSSRLHSRLHRPASETRAGAPLSNAEPDSQAQRVSAHFTAPEPPRGDGPADSSDEWIYVVRGRSFLRNMVRKMVGTLLEVGRGKLVPSDIPRLLAQRDRSASGPTAPPHALSLDSVEYAPDAVDE